MTIRLILHYRILAELGQGGMGQVFRARDERLGREVALKFLPAELEGDADFQARMMREARAASAINHPGLVTLYDLESFEGRTFLVMELVEGESFSKLAARGASWKEAVTLVAGVAEALAIAHARGILHRDIKSDNLMITPTGQPKVLDFGLAKLRDVNAPISPGALASSMVDPETGITANMKKRPELSERSIGLAATVRPVGGGPNGLTQAGQLLGTPAYMAPECFEGIADARSEVFALGIVLYELLVGRRPFDRESELAMMSAILLDEAEPPSRVAPDRNIPADVDVLVARALAKAPDQRFADMSSFASALRSLLADRPSAPFLPPPDAARSSSAGIVATTTPTPARGAMSSESRAVPRWWYLAGATAMVALTIGGWYIVRNVVGAPPPPTTPATTAPSAPPTAVSIAPLTIEVSSSRRITLDPRCEEYPRQHPDGRRVVYDGVVDDDYEIMVVDLETSQHTRLTTSPGWDYASALSPDGTQVAFVHEDVSGRTLRMLRLDGTEPPRNLGAIVGYPAWSHDGALLVGDANAHIVRRDIATGTETILGTLPAGARLYHLVDVKDAGIAVRWWTSSDADATSLGELDRNGHLRVIEEFATDYEGGLSAAGNGRGYYATRKGATEGNQLLYRAWGGMKPVAVPGVAPGAGIDVRPDGKRLVFSTCTEREYIVRIGTADPTHPVTLSRGAWQDTNPHVLDARHILITSNRLGAAQGWVIDLDAKSPPRAVTPSGALGSAASPDGTLVVYTTRTGLRIDDLRGGPTRTLTTDSSDAAPAFTHDGKHVVFERTIGGITQVFAIAAAGGEAPRSLFAGEAAAASPVDDRVVFLTTADVTGARRLMVGSLMGEPPKPLPGVEPATWHRPKFSPDGKRLLVVRGYQQLVEVSLDAKRAPRVVWTTTTGSVNTATWLPDGTSIVAGVGGYEGDLWLADGIFP